MKAVWEKMLQSYEVMAKREQVLVFISVLLVLFTIWYLVVWGVIEHFVTKSKSTLRRVKQETTVLQDDVALQNARLAQDPNYVIEKKQAKLQDDVKKLDEELGIYSKQLLTAKSMMKALKAITLKADGVKITGVKITGVDVLPDEKEQATEDSQVPLYRHGVQLQFISDYFATTAYLEKIEQIPWRLFWDKLDYRVGKYPNAKVTLVIHTLSEEHDE